jgi:pilus assembly protein CpaB
MVAVGCGFVASLGVYQYLRAASDKEQTKSILVAIKEININQPLNEQNVRVEQWPSRQIPQGSLGQLKQIDAKYARIRLYPGEPILAAKVMNWDDASSSLKIPKGFRAVSVKVTMDSSVSSLIEPGDKVDVIVVMKRSQDAPAMSKTILKLVQVFAVNTEMAKSPDKDKTLEEVRTISLLLDPEGAERLAMGQEMGTVRLTLRSPDDPLIDDTPGCSVDRLFGRGTVADIDDDARDASGPPVNDSETDSLPNTGGWSMVIESPERTEGYSFDRSGQAPKLDSIRYKSGNQPPWATQPAQPAEQRDAPPALPASDPREVPQSLLPTLT